MVLFAGVGKLGKYKTHRSRKSPRGLLTCGVQQVKVTFQNDHMSLRFTKGCKGDNITIYYWQFVMSNGAGQETTPRRLTLSKTFCLRW